jgi:hypothetical protein
VLLVSGVVDNSRGDYDIVNARGRSPCGPIVSFVTNSSVERDGGGSRTKFVFRCNLIGRWFLLFSQFIIHV